MFVRFFRFSIGRTERFKKILFEILISGRVGRAGLAWKLRPQDLNLEVGWSYNVCSIFRVFFSAGRSKVKKNFVWNFVLTCFLAGNWERLKIQILRWGVLQCLFDFSSFFRLDGEKLRKILIGNLISRGFGGKLGMTSRFKSWGGGSHDVCSIFQVFGRTDENSLWTQWPYKSNFLYFFKNFFSVQPKTRKIEQTL